MTPVWVTELLEPTSALWLLLVFGGAWQFWRRRWHAAASLLGFAALFGVAGNPRLSAALLATLEQPYAGQDVAQLRPADAIVMLGGVLQPSAHDLFHFDLQDAADRVVTAAELAREGKAKALFLGGGAPRPGEPGEPEGVLVKRWLQAWNVPHVPIVLLGACHNTHDEALHTQAVLRQRGWKSVILVTSAAHMRRGEALFRRLGIPVTPVACDFRGLSTLAKRPVLRFLPTSGGLEMLNIYLHEEIGWWVYRWRGWVK